MKSGEKKTNNKIVTKINSQCPTHAFKNVITIKENMLGFSETEGIR